MKKPAALSVLVPICLIAVVLFAGAGYSQFPLIEEGRPPAINPTPQVAQRVERVEMLSPAISPTRAQASSDRFRSAIGRAIRDARRNRSITARDAMRIRVAMLSPAFRKYAEDLAVTQMAFYDGEGGPTLARTASGRVDRTAIDWDGLASFLERFLPLLLDLLNSFASLEFQSDGGVA